MAQSGRLVVWFIANGSGVWQSDSQAMKRKRNLKGKGKGKETPERAHGSWTKISSIPVKETAVGTLGNFAGEPLLLLATLPLIFLVPAFAPLLLLNYLR
jgi:hypothetical protein